MSGNGERAAELERLILSHQRSYYDGEAVISDGEFDLLWDELAKLAPDSPVLQRIGTGAGITVNSAGVTADGAVGVADGFPKARHLIPMGSQDKAANPAEFRAWAVKTGISPMLVQYKLDGASLELQYERGKLVRAVTRGDGTVGDEITGNAKKMAGVPEKLDVDFSGGVRGEVVMSREVWREKYSSKANCRNAANGIMRRKDGSGCEDLLCITYDVTEAGDLAVPPPPGGGCFATETAKIQWLKSRGFYTAESLVCADADEVIAYREKVSGRRAELPFDIDGLVVKDIVTDLADLRRARPEKQVAFKFDLEAAFSILREVQWSESGATYTPVGIVDPVRIAGTTVRRASLNNPGLIRALGLKIGSAVSVVKRGEIIPKIEGLAPEGALPPEALPPEQHEIGFPATCSVCASTLTDCGTRLFCPNADCPKRLHQRLEKWAKVLDIRELGDKLILRLFEKGRVRRPADLYTLTAEELAAYERMGELSAAKVVRHIRSGRRLSLAAFVAGFNLEGIAETTMEKVCDAGFDTLEKLRRASVEELAAIHGLGEITAAAIVEGLAETAAEMDAVLAAGVITIADPPASDLPLHGLSFCFTGELSSMKRGKAEDAVKSLGGTAKAAVVKGLSFLVSGDPGSGSAKNAKARSLGIPVIGEERFLEMLATPTGAGAPAQGELF